MTPSLERIRYAEASVDSQLLQRFTAALMLLVLSPVIVVVAVTIFLLSHRHPLIRHQRVGWQGRPLSMLKFRTMWGRYMPARSIEAPPVKTPDDPRITSRFARFCRSHSLDELPQLVHVFRGEMSFVGPRPITAAELEDYYGACTGEVLSVRPGLTGLWQVRGRSRLNYARRRRLDLLLVRRNSAALRLHILVCSLRGVCSGRDAW